MKCLAFLLLIAALILPGRNFAQTYPPGFGQLLVANGIANPTAMAFAPDGRILICEQAGKVRVIKNNTLLAAPFVQLTVSSSGERGLIGIAVDPDFLSNHFIYLYHTVPGNPAHNRIVRFTANGDVALEGSQVVVLDLDPLSAATNHNGGAMHFGKDGKLYVAIGENANSAHAQNLDTYHGKLLRINKDGSVPEGNPFTTGSEQRKRVWAYGLRNPYTFSIHPETGRILVNDVGQVTWEEINDATAGGKNFGWPTTEGKFNPATYPMLTNPIYAYNHGSGDGKGCAITGGTFFYPTVTNYPSSYVGKYFFQDLCNRWINSLDLPGDVARASFATLIQGNSLALTVGNDGNLYYLSRASSAVYKIIYNSTTAPFILRHPTSVTIAEGQTAQFTVKVLGTTPFQYQWQKDGVDISGATNDTLLVENALPANEGDYSVIISNEAGKAVSNAATLSINRNTAPIAKILTPTSETTYAAGTTVEFTGTANDNEDGPLPSTSLRWQINFHHGTHVHDEPALDGISTGVFNIPNQGETSDDVWYRIILTAIDSRGLQGKDSVDIFPRTSTISISTTPPGLEVLVDGQPFETPAVIKGVEGILRTFSVNTPQFRAEVAYEFESWSNGGEITQTFATPTDDLMLVANFSIVVGTETPFVQPDFLIYPNPVNNGVAVLKLTTGRRQEIRVRVLNVLSQEVFAEECNLVQGENEIRFNTGSLSNGVYSLVVEFANSLCVTKLVVNN